MNKLFLIILVGVVFLLSGCSDFRQATGREKIKFDEFTVLEQKSLEIPQNFELEFSNINPSEQTDSIDEFNNLLKITSRTEMDNIDEYFSAYFNLEQIELGIREIVFKETEELKNSSRSGYGLLINDEPGPLINEILDAEEEIERLTNLGISPIN